MNKSNQSILSFVILALVPYSKPNLMLTFKPNMFFNELEKISSHSERNLKMAYERARKINLILMSQGRVELSLPARQLVQPFIASNLYREGQLMVVFDIPVELNHRRRQFRTLLKHLGFSQSQQSVWISSQDHREILVESIHALDIQQFVKLYEASPIAIS